jgi:predicted NBD/HSP70 family sugar kinase
VVNIANTIGLDIGGTHISAVVLNSKNKILKKSVIGTPGTQSSLKRALRSLVFRLDKKARRIGIGAAGVISGKVLKKAPNIRFSKNFSFLETFPSPFGIAVDNDARVFLKSEWIWGKIPKKSKVMGFTIGTGIGRALGKNGKVLKIKKFEYPEKWEKEYQKIRDFKDTKTLAAYLAKKLSLIIKHYRPEIIILGGGMVTGRKQNFLAPFKKELKKLKIKSEIRKTKLGNIAGAVGSALLAKKI